MVLFGFRCEASSDQFRGGAKLSIRFAFSGVASGTIQLFGEQRFALGCLSDSVFDSFDELIEFIGLCFDLIWAGFRGFFGSQAGFLLFSFLAKSIGNFILLIEQVLGLFLHFTQGLIKCTGGLSAKLFGQVGQVFLRAATGGQCGAGVLLLGCLRGLLHLLARFL